MSITDIELVHGPPASALLSDASFIARWQGLIARCADATVFQSPWFVRTWYEAYRSKWQPVIVRSHGAAGELNGLWLLAYDPGAGMLVHAGTDQAEYQTWMTLPGEGARFLREAWRALRQLRGARLEFRYLPTLESAVTLARALRGRVVVRRRHRPLLLLDPAEIAASFAKKSNKSRFNRLKRLGQLEFRRLSDPAELAGIIDNLITYYDFRHGAVHRSTPFRLDPQRRAFHLAMFAAGSADLFVTVTYLNGRPIAAFWGAATGPTVHLVMIVYSPMLAAQSPGKLHLMQLNELLLRAGKTVLDFTPGDDPWKARFADAHDGVAQATLYRSAWACTAMQVLSGIRQSGQRCARALGVKPADVQASLVRLRRARPASLFRKLREGTWMRREFRVYRAERRQGEAHQEDARVRSNCLADLLAFEPGEPWQTRAGFLSGALARLERGEICYTMTVGSRLAHSGWLVPPQEESYMTEVQQSLLLPPGSVMLCNFYTDPQFRGRGLYRAALGHMLRAAFAADATRFAYIAVLADNLPSRRVIESEGFEFQQSFFLQRILGIERKWAGPMVGRGP